MNVEEDPLDHMPVGQLFRCEGVEESQQIDTLQGNSVHCCLLALSNLLSFIM